MPPDHSSEKSIAILEAAIGAFRDKGFAATRISDIAQRAGVGKGTVYEYYASKEQLLLDACLHVCRRNELDMSGGLELDPATGFQAPPGSNLVLVIHNTLRAVIQTLLVSSRSEFQLFSDLQHVSREHPEVMQRAQAEIRGKLEQWRGFSLHQHRLGIEAGLLRPLAEQDWVARLVVATVDGLIWQQMWNEDEDPASVAGGIARTWCRLNMVEPERLEDHLG